jgi:hypothetical protein
LFEYRMAGFPAIQRVAFIPAGSRLGNHKPAGLPNRPANTPDGRLARVPYRWHG